MAARTESASSESLSRTTGLLNHNAAYTVCCWFYMVSDVNDYTHMIALGDGGAPDWANADFLGTDSDGTTLRLGAVLNQSSTAVTGSTLGAAKWHHLALVRESSASLKGYLNGVRDVTSTDNISGRVATAKHHVGILNGLGANGRFAAWKEWAVALTADEIKQEMFFYIPITHRFEVKAWHPMGPGASERVRDYSGNDFPWTENGTISDEDGPPISWEPPLWVPFVAAAAAEAQPRSWDRAMPFVFQ